MWHFVAENRKLGYDDGRVVKPGQTSQIRKVGNEMTTTFMRDFERDPALYVRRQLERLSAQNEREVEAAAKARREDELVRGYAARREPPEAA